ncbi:MAG: hypothetical protein AAF560_08085 [Acidobacteriota bacterium]
MRTRRRGLSEIRTLGGRRETGGHHKALLKASAIEAELQRLQQEQRLLNQRLTHLDQRVNELQSERDRLLATVETRRTGDTLRHSRGRTFHLEY